LRQHGFQNVGYFNYLAFCPDLYSGSYPDLYFQRVLTMANRWGWDVQRLRWPEPDAWIEPKVDYVASLEGAWREAAKTVVQEGEEDWFEMYINY
jgi:hypothetical protein